MVRRTSDGWAVNLETELVKHCYQSRSNFVHGTIYRDGKLLMANKSDLLAELDAAVFCPEKLSDLRRQANRFWGLGDSDVERLHAADWTSKGVA